MENRDEKLFSLLVFFGGKKIEFRFLKEGFYYLGVLCFLICFISEGVLKIRDILYFTGVFCKNYNGIIDTINSVVEY